MSALFCISGFVASYISADLMHVADLGLLGVVLGNVVYELFREMHGTNATRRSVCSELLRLMRVASNKLEIPPPVNFLTFSMFKTDAKAPKFKLKAAEARRMLQVVNFMLGHFFPAATPHSKLRFECVRLLHDLYKDLEAWQPESGPKVASLARKHLALYSELSREVLEHASPETWTAWRIYPKFHIFVHVCELQIALQGNPRWSWCYQDESEIGAAVRCAEHAHPNTLHRALMQKYRLGW